MRAGVDDTSYSYRQRNTVDRAWHFSTNPEQQNIYRQSDSSRTISALDKYSAFNTAQEQHTFSTETNGEQTIDGTHDDGTSVSAAISADAVPLEPTKTITKVFEHSSDLIPANCEKCSASVSISRKTNAIDNVCVFQQVNEPYFFENHKESTQCRNCGTRLSLAGRKSANTVGHVCACYKIKLNGCSRCGAGFTKRVNVRRHTKSTGPCSSGEMVMLERQRNEERPE